MTDIITQTIIKLINRNTIANCQAVLIINTDCIVLSISNLEMKTTSNFCKDHHLVLKYICMKQDCPCISKRYCEKCLDNHYQKHNSKCIPEDQIVLNIKARIQPYSLLKDKNQAIKQKCRLQMKKQRTKQMNTVKIIRSQFTRYKETVESKLTKFQRLIKSSQNRLNQLHNASKSQFLKELQCNEVLKMRIDLSNPQGLLQLHNIAYMCKTTLKQYDKFLEQTKDYCNSKEGSIDLQKFENIIIKGVIDTLDLYYKPIKAQKDQDLPKPQDKLQKVNEVYVNSVHKPIEIRKNTYYQSQKYY